jgi:Restriction endonuclease/Protein of unknown function (DUF2510)
MASESVPPAGWFTDPAGLPQWRFWDGANWTEHVAPGALAQATSAEGSARPPGSTLAAESPASDQVALHQSPGHRLIRTAADAEEVAAEWMRFWGYSDARRTPTGPDSGIDVDSSTAVAQVKAHHRPVGRPDIQKLQGVAMHLGRAALFFSLESYTREATEWANAAGVALFRFDLQGTPAPENEAAIVVTRRAGAGGSTWSVAEPSREPEPIRAAVPEVKPVWAFPVTCSDDAIVRTIAGQRQGRLGGKEQLLSLMQSWELLWRVQIDYTSPTGRRGALVQHSTQLLFDALTGEPVSVASKDTPAFVQLAPSAPHLSPVWTGKAIRGEIVQTWNRLIELRQAAARQRYVTRLSQLGVPAHARTISVRGEPPLRLPVFIGVLKAPSDGGRRLVVVNGYTGKLSEYYSQAMTVQFNRVVNDLSVPGVRTLQVVR